MQLVEEWLCAHNLPKLPVQDRARLEGEALRYAVVTFLHRPFDLPDEVVQLLAEDYFAKVYADSGVT
jgi:hypothetical protein